jgi:anti-sigma factor RsiW
VDPIDNRSSGSWESGGPNDPECVRVREVLHAYADGELDLVRAIDVERHLRQCEACGRAEQSLRAVRSVIADGPLYHRAPAGLEKRIRVAARAEVAGGSAMRLMLPRWVAAAAAVLLGVLLIARVVHGPIGSAGGPGRLAQAEAARTVEEVVAGHVRSLMADHLVDVASSDRHTVKPWFNGKLDFTPDVRDFAEEGFPLQGGRLDYIAGHPAAALVYRRGGHYVNLFIWPATDASSSAPPDAEKSCTANGYHVARWRHAGLSYWAVTDADESTLRQFTRLARSERPTTSP